MTIPSAFRMPALCLCVLIPAAVAQLPGPPSRPSSPTMVSSGLSSISPAIAAQGSTGLRVSFALDPNAFPPPPPAAISPSRVFIGSMSGANITRQNQQITATFNIPAAEPVGQEDAGVVFETPNGTLTIVKAKAFQIQAGSAKPPTALFSAVPTTGTAPLHVSFSDTSTGEVSSRLWDFGDRTTSTTSNPAHTYTAAGTYTVRLTVYGPGGTNSLSRDTYITVSDGAVKSVLSYPVVDTGQNKCYNATTEIAAPLPAQPFYGQDAQFSGSKPSYTLSADSKTVLDNVTKLTWMRGPNTTLAAPVASDKMTFTAAQAWVARVNALAYGGFSDWRLPTIKELFSLVNFTGTDPSGASGDNTQVLTPFIDTRYFNFGYGQVAAGERIIDSQYLSSTVFAVNPAETGYPKVFGLNLADGRIKGYDLMMPGGREKTFFVQLVRGPSAYGVNHFIDNGDGTVSDVATGLMWSKADSGSAMTWQQALAWAESKNTANYLGHNDWRLPHAKELQSLVNYSNAPDFNGKPAIDTVYFSSTGIANENGDADFPFYWSSTTHTAYSANGSAGDRAVYVAFGRALGYMSNGWVDVHGAGAQRSDPKTGPPFSFADVHTTAKNGTAYAGYAFGPQGDALRGLNFVRLVR